MKDGYYIVETANYVFDMSVVKYRNNYSIQYGDSTNREGPCVDLLYNTNDDYIELQSLAYYSRCSSNKELEPGTGTREMIMSILKICIEAFTGVKRIVLKDVADFHCNNKRVLLSYYSLLLYGQTWYERHFKARPVHKEDNETLDEFRKPLNDKPKKGVFSFYEPGDYENWHRFFESYKKNNGCGFFHEYQSEFENISQTKLFYSSWYIRARDIKDYDVTYSIKKSKTNKQFGGVYRRTQALTEEDGI
jgi:hypothetical protein